jgi:hypothetical protein
MLGDLLYVSMGKAIFVFPFIGVETLVYLPWQVPVPAGY